ncbi:MAG: protein TolR [Fluviicoccus sp.]|uniref:protein TolR n=1 Tax=Fluviicoccus sp. TaxID=2003552 RepID=UPI0027206C0F|nr:protein TolR [Fluviicoccus sp.]MDO8329280.1 protein TolR [Fluviicoccus sp.]
MMEQSPFHRPARRLMSDMNVVPYIDVMLVLVVIFMITAPMLTQGLKVELPEAAADTINIDSEDPVVITIKADGSYWLKQGSGKDKRLKLDDMIQALKAVEQSQPKAQILLNGDTHVDYGRVVKLMAALQQAGLTRVGLLTVSPES